jgi:hypothetical protein
MLKYLSDIKISLDKLLFVIIIIIILFILIKKYRDCNEKENKQEYNYNLLEKYEDFAVNVSDIMSIKPEDQTKVIINFILQLNNIKKMILYGIEPLLNERVLNDFLRLLNENLSKINAKNIELFLGTELFNKNKSYIMELEKFFKNDYVNRINNYNRAIYDDKNSNRNENRNVNVGKSNISPWLCVSDVTTPLRRNNKNIECMSENGKDCFWHKNMEDCNNLIKKNPNPDNIHPVQCNKAGYDNKDHWCNKGNYNLK